MEILNKLKKIISVICIIFTVSFTVNAQESVAKYSASTLKKFIKATKDVSNIQQEAEQKMINEIQQENLDVETFNKIAEMMINPELAENSDVTPAQIESFNNVLQKLQIIQVQIQQEMETAIRDSGMQIDEYQQIVEDYHKNPELQQKINKMLQ